MIGMKFIRHIFSVAFISLAVMNALAGESQEAVDRFVEASGINPASVAVKIIDLSDGEVLAAHNEARPLVPASIMKSVSIASLLDDAGISYRYHTPVFIDGPVDMGVVRGNLIVQGACDPSLHSRENPGSTDLVLEICKSLRQAGINKIEGEIIIDEAEFAGPSRPDSWMAADFSKSYGTGSHAFNFEDNARGQRSVENPKSVFAGRLRSKLLESNIYVDGKDLGEGKRTRLFTHVSAPLDEIMRSCMMRSDNLYAESMLRTFGRLNGGDGSTQDAAKREYAKLEKMGMPLEGVEIVDGSGLSRSNRVTADFMGAVLERMSVSPDYASFFPLAGQEGTLRKFLAETPLDSYIAMKTGSMKGIQCYAGYKLDENYAPTHVVVVIMNDLNGSRYRAKKAAQRMLLDIFNENNNEENE